MAKYRVDRNNGLSEQDARSRLLNSWKDRWSQDGPASRTKELIPDLKVWLSRRHGDMDYHMTQYYTGHGNFNRTGRRQEPACMYCGRDDDAEHTFIDCNRWDQYRTDSVFVEKSTGGITTYMLQSIDKWNEVTGYIKRILKTKDEDERLQGY
ncbi:uncharacterized protein LOC142326866 [Lycorma delicatula]|uniref:uncharacterized protein LOC142326866 n=1 Tax=Lycorma delicatula TaxID=130591 RepID=UPI003F50EECB